jgi:sec-independent protein translocase protein TatA
MGTFSWVHWLLVAIVVLILFGGRGKISSLMGDFAQGIKAFKKGMSEDDTAKTDTPPADQATRPDRAQVRGQRGLTVGAPEFVSESGAPALRLAPLAVCGWMKVLMLSFRGAPKARTRNPDASTAFASGFRIAASRRPE